MRRARSSRAADRRASAAAAFDRRARTLAFRLLPQDCEYDRTRRRVAARLAETKSLDRSQLTGSWRTWPTGEQRYELHLLRGRLRGCATGNAASLPGKARR